MRLTLEEIAAIKDCARTHFGADAVVRLFGSRLRDNFEGGDIDVHVTTDQDGLSFAKNFRYALGKRLPEEIDLHVIHRGDKRRPIDDIAILTGEIVAGPPFPLHADQDPAGKARMTLDAYRQIIAEAIAAGHRAQARLAETLDDLSAKLPLDEDTVRGLSKLEQLLIDSLLLQYGSLVATVQDQLIRGMLLAAECKLPARDREAQRLRAQSLGMLGRDIDLPAIASARNRVAHHYPADPGKQAVAVNEVIAAIPLALCAFASLTRYAEAEGTTQRPSP